MTVEPITIINIYDRMELPSQYSCTDDLLI